jgi:hypothetical protein
MKNGHRVYDTHTHLGAARHSGRRQNMEQMLASMDTQGVDRSMLIPFPVVEDFRATHDQIAAALAAQPERFAGAACLDPFVPEQIYRDEIKRCAEELGFTAIKIQPQYQALNPIHTRNDFLYECAALYNMAVIVHTGAGAPFALPSLYIMPARRFPEVPIVLGHCGGGVYSLESIVAASVCPNIYIEVSSLMPHHIHEVLQFVPTNRIMAGSDLIESLDAEMHKIFTLNVSEPDRANILWNTARAVFDGESA